MKKSVLMIDNYDSFTYNLVQYLGELGAELTVVRNDTIKLSDIETLSPSHIVLSPGPGRPENAGITPDIIRHLYKKIPILGVCLGHQAIGYVFGATITYAPSLMHGKTSLIEHDAKGVFYNVPNPFTATRYHSLVIDKATLPEELVVTAQTPDGVLMGVRHCQYPLEGVQFHPESILTEHGKELLNNFLQQY